MSPSLSQNASACRNVGGDGFWRVSSVTFFTLPETKRFKKIIIIVLYMSLNVLGVGDQGLARCRPRRPLQQGARCSPWKLGLGDEAGRVLDEVVVFEEADVAEGGLHRLTLIEGEFAEVLAGDCGFEVFVGADAVRVSGESLRK